MPRDRHANPEKERAAQRRRYAANPEKYREMARRRRVANPAYSREYYFKRFHGMRPEDWQGMLDDQQGSCYLCGNPLDLASPGAIHVDHDHSCCPAPFSCAYCRRGLACDNCNKAIGMFLDDSELIRRVADNLERATAEARSRIAAKPVQETLIA